MAHSATTERIKLLRFTTILIFGALLGAAALPLAAADFSGKWKIEGDIQGNPVNLDCSFQQNPQDKLTGKCTINNNDSVDIEGAIKGEKVTFAFTAGGYTLTYTGTLQPETVAGDIEVAGTTGSFSGKRAK
jgi:hypothetical protein